MSINETNTFGQGELTIVVKARVINDGCDKTIRVFSEHRNLFGGLNEVKKVAVIDAEV